MKQRALILALGAGLAAFGAQAGITQAPTGPSQVSLNWAVGVVSEGLGDNLGGTPPALSFDLVASGDAWMNGHDWVANVTSVTGDLIRLGGDSAGLTINTNSELNGFSSSTWKDITINLATQQVTGDRYVDGSLVSSDEQIFAVGDVLHQAEGKADLWRGPYIGEMVLTSVPEPSSGLAMALGLVAMASGVRRAHRSHARV